MRTDTLCIAAILTVVPALALAQDGTEQPRGTLSIIVENDKFSAINSDKQTDRNFTNGIRLNWISEPRSTPEWGLKLAGWVPMFPEGGTTRVGYAFGQNMYTPENIQRRDHIVDDRPYSGWTYLGAAITSSRSYGDSAQLDTLEVNLGIVGPQSYAAETQREYHRLINSPLPQGWNNQLKNEPGLVLFYERKWRNVGRSQILPGIEGDFSPHVGASLGNVFTYAGTGVTLRVGHNLGVDYGAPRIRPGLAGSMHFDTVETDPFAAYAFIGAEGRAVGRDITLDGNTFANSYSVDRRPLVADIQMGFAIVYAPVRFTFTYVMRTREFETQRSPDRFGALSFSMKF
jgi:lipid A 3-O-deacylase